MNITSLQPSGKTMLTPIIILCLLSLPLLIAFLISRLRDIELNIHKYACLGLGITFIFFFIGHIVKTDEMIQMLPVWLPMRTVIIYITGILELVVGIALFIPRIQIAASKLAILIFIAFFPANVYAALNSIGVGGHQWGPVYLFIRTPLQIILIAWTYYLCVKGHILKDYLLK